ncbi:MAG: lasso RiPP family leader peptide-containing protein [Candidatus Acidiferrales bacterium]
MRENKTGKESKSARRAYEPPRLREYGSLTEIVRGKMQGSATDPVGGQPTKQTVAS